jgi:hypothetical protein
MDTRMIVLVEGIELPGRRCGPNPQGEWYENVHVGLCTRDRRHPGSVEVTRRRPRVVTNPVAGDAPSASWQLEIIVRSGGDGVDFDGPFVRGKRGDRHIGLAWGEVPGDGTFRLVRGAKLRLTTLSSMSSTTRSKAIVGSSPACV